MVRLIFEKLLFFFRCRQNLSAFLLYIGIISFIYAPVVFLGRSLQAPLFYQNIVTEEGVYGYQGRKPVNSLNVDLTNGVFTDFPINKFIGDVYKKGQLPLWNPYQSAGQPSADWIGAGAFHPYRILQNVSPIKGYDFFMLGRLLIAGFFTFLFLRLLNISWLSSFLGGLLFMFSGSFTVFMQNEEAVNVVMMIPVLLWAIERLFSRPNGRNIALLALVFALLLTSGTPGVILYTLFLGAAYFVFRVITLKAAKIKNFFLIVFAFILGLGLSAPLIFLFVEFLGNTINLRAFHGLISKISWELLGLIISPVAAEIPTFYRITHPVNGLWDFFGGYTGILSVYLIILGCLIAAIFFKRKIRHQHISLFLFFLGFGLFIFLKNLGLPPFVWLGYLPFFNIVWSSRWAGPIWVFCLTVAGALGFELLKEAGGLIFEVIRQSKRLRIFSVSALGLCSFILLTAPLYFYQQSDRLLDFDSVAKTSFLTRWELFTTSWLASFLILALAIYLIRSFIKDKNKNALYSLAALALLELWLWVPRGYDLDSMRFKFGLFLFGLIIVAFVWKGKRLWVLAGVFIFFLSFLFLDVFALQGLPQRYNPFTEPPYIRYLKEQSGYWRVMGDTTALMPNWASAFEIMDVRYIAETGTPSWFHYFRKNNLDNIPGYFGVLSHWFTGRSYEDKETESDIKHVEIKKDLCPSMSVSEFLNLGKYDHVEDKIRTQLPFYQLLGVKYILTNAPDINKNIGKDNSFYFPQVYKGEVNIFENRLAFPRAFIAYNVEYASSFTEAQGMIREENFDLRRKIVLEEKLPSENYLGPEKENFASITDYGYNKVAIKAKTETPGILVLSDVFYPGWKAEIDGKPAKIYRVDGLIRGVYLPSGIHEVVFNYWPPSFAKGLVVALLSFFACLILVILKFKQRPRKIAASIIIFLLIIPSLYFYFQSFQNFIYFSKFKSETEIKEEVEKTIEEEKEESRGEEYGESRQYEESRQSAISFIYENIEDFTAFQDNSDKKWIPAQFLFPEDSSQKVYVVLRSENKEAERKILIYKKEIEDFFHKPISKFTFSQKGISLLEWQLEEMFSIPELLYSNFYFDRNIQAGTIRAKIYMVVGYFEKINGRWVLGGGNDLLSGRDLVSYKYDCDKFGWLRQ